MENVSFRLVNLSADYVKKIVRAKDSISADVFFYLRGSSNAFRLQIRSDMDIVFFVTGLVCCCNAMFCCYREETVGF